MWSNKRAIRVLTEIVNRTMFWSCARRSWIVIIDKIRANQADKWRDRLWARMHEARLRRFFYTDYEHAYWHKTIHQDYAILTPKN